MLNIDFIYATISYVNGGYPVRVLRIFRAIWLIAVSNVLWKIVRAIYFTLPQIFDVFLLFFAVIIIFAFFGKNMMANMKGEFDPIDETDYFSYKNAFWNTFLMTTLSNYPASAIPFLKWDDIEALYFVPFLVLIMTVLIPIPTAVIFDRFRGNWMKVLLEDRMREKEGLFLSFVCLDYKR